MPLARHRPALHPPARRRARIRCPLLLAHGWPGSVWEFNKLIPLLTDPGRFGGDPADAFTVVAPSLPGYTLLVRARPAALRRGRDRGRLRRPDDRRARLSALRRAGRRLGRLRRRRTRRCTTPTRSDRHPPELPAGARRPPVPRRARREKDRIYQKELEHWQKRGDRLPRDPGHQAADARLRADRLAGRPGGAGSSRSSRPGATIAATSRAGFDRDALLTNIMLYWVTGAINSSFWPYYAIRHEPWPLPGTRIETPTGYAEFPVRDRATRRARSPRARSTSSAGREMPRGGHFAALEEPDAAGRGRGRVLPAAAAGLSGLLGGRLPTRP